jgi:hypothetical protein
MRQRGSGLLDAIAATAVAITMGAAATDLTGATRALRSLMLRDQLLTVARNRLDHTLGAPCAALPVCDSGFVCGLAFEPLDGILPGARRATVSVIADAEAASVSLSTAIPPGCG